MKFFYNIPQFLLIVVLHVYNQVKCKYIDITIYKLMAKSQIPHPAISKLITGSDSNSAAT